MPRLKFYKTPAELPDESKPSYISDDFGAVMPAMPGGITFVNQSGLRKVKPSIVTKGWGREIVFADGAGYTGKILEHEPDTVGSLHFHLRKHETWYVLKGVFKIVSIDKITAKRETKTLNPGDRWINEPGQAHQLYTSSGGMIFEVSSPDDPDDTYRIEPGDSQK